MDNTALELVKNIITIVGGMGGLVYLGYFLKEKLRKKEVNLRYISGSYEIETSKTDINDIKAIVELAIHNDTDEKISLTDVMGTIKYNKQKYEQNIELLLKTTKDTKDTKTERPSNYREATHFTIGPRELKQTMLLFKFADVVPNLIERMWLSKYVGAFNGDLPLLSINEREILRDWEKYPLNLLLSVHINGKKLIQQKCPLYIKNSIEQGNLSGSLTLSDQVQIEKKFRDDKSVSIVEPTKTKIRI